MNLRFIKQTVLILLLLPAIAFSEDNTPSITTLEFDSFVPFSNTADNYSPKLSADGNIVAFHSKSTYTNRATPNFYNLYVINRDNNEIQLISTPANIFPETEKANGSSFGYEVSNDGDLIAVCSHANNLIENDANNQMDLFAYRRSTGELYRVSVSSEGEEGNGRSCVSSISANGRYIAFDSTANNLVHNDYNNHSDIFIHDILTRSITWINTAQSAIGELTGLLGASISGNGRYTTFIAKPVQTQKQNIASTYTINHLTPLNKSVFLNYLMAVQMAMLPHQ